MQFINRILHWLNGTKYTNRVSVLFKDGTRRELEIWSNEKIVLIDIYEDWN